MTPPEPPKGGVCSGCGADPGQPCLCGNRELLDKLKERDATLEQMRTAHDEYLKLTDAGMDQAVAKIEELEATIASLRDANEYLKKQGCEWRDALEQTRGEIEGMKREKEDLELTVMTLSNNAKGTPWTAGEIEAASNRAGYMARIIELQAELSDAKEKMGKIREYAQHTEECCWGGTTADNKFNVECSCGLAALYQERPAHPYDKDKKEGA